VRDADTGADARKLAGDELRKVVELLSRLEEVVKIVHRRGIDFAELLAVRERTGKLPQYFLVIDGEEHLLTADERAALQEEFQLVLEQEGLGTNGTNGTNGDGTAVTTAADGNGAKPVKRVKRSSELHEVKDLDRVFAEMSQYGLSIDDYFLTQEESVSGERLRTKYALVNDDKTHDVAGVSQILPQVLAVGKQGIEVKRFKGLGEMNADQLWETTLNRDNRVLLRVTLEQANEAEQMFSILMGEDVERRRQFIEEHALEVKNLDV